MIFNMRAKEVLGVIESDSTKLVGSYDSVLKINKIGGVCEQGANPSPTNPQEIKKTVVSGIKTHGKNVLINLQESKTVNGITFTVNKDKSITVRGTATAMTDYHLNSSLPIIMDKEYIISGCSGGSISTYFLRISDIIYSSSDCVNGYAVFTPRSQRADVFIRIMNGVTINTTIYPMVCFAENTDSTYEPYIESSITLSQPIELYGIGEVQDTIEGGEIKRRFSHFKNNGFKAVDGYDVGTSKLMALAIPDNVPNSWSYNNMYSACNKLPAKNVLAVDESGFYVVDFVIYARIKGCSSADEFNAQMADAEFVYPIETETTELLPTKDQMTLNTLQTFNGVTYVEFDSEVQPTLNSDYATNSVGAVALSVNAYNEIEKRYIKYNNDGSVRFNGNVNVDEWVIANNLQAYQMVYADSIQTYKGITATTDVTAQNNVVAQNELRGKDLHFTNMGVNGGVAQPVEWVWDATLARWVLCTVQ